MIDTYIIQEAVKMAKVFNSVTDAFGLTDSKAPARYAEQGRRTAKSITDTGALEAKRIAAAVPEYTFGYGDSVLSDDGAIIDPEIIRLKEEGRGFSENTLKNIQDARKDVVGNRNDFISRRTSGLRSDITKGGKALESRLNKTGVTGEFATQSKENYVTTAAQKLATGQLLASNELFGLEGDFDKLEGGAVAVLKGLNSNDFAQKMQAAGMGDDLVRSLTQIQQRKAEEYTRKYLAEAGEASAESGSRAQESAQEKASTQSLIGNIALGAAMFFSSRSFKHSMEPVDNQEILDSMMELDVELWKYNGEDETHIGCYAEDFNEHFGEKGAKEIKVVDIVGVLMASIQAQQKQIDRLTEKLSDP